VPLSVMHGRVVSVRCSDKYSAGRVCRSRNCRYPAGCLVERLAPRHADIDNLPAWQQRFCI
jgi:hypothetical protein